MLMRGAADPRGRVGRALDPRRVDAQRNDPEAAATDLKAGHGTDAVADERQRRDSLNAGFEHDPSVELPDADDRHVVAAAISGQPS